MALLGDVLGRPWGVLGASWWRFGRDLGVLVTILGHPGSVWDVLGGVLATSWGALGVLVAILRRPVGVFWGVLGAFWGRLGHLGRVLTVSWGCLGAILGLLGTSWGLFGGRLGGSCSVLWVSRGRLESVLILNCLQTPNDRFFHRIFKDF